MVDTTRRAFLKTGGAATTISLLAGCSTGDGDGDGGGDGGDGSGDGDSDGGGATTGTPGTPAEPIVVGALEPVSGPFAQWAEPHQAGLEYAIDEINADGGVLDRELELTVSDTGADPAAADSEFRRMVEQEDVVVTTGAVSSDVATRLGQTAQDLAVPHVVNRAGANSVITEDRTFIYRFTQPPASQYMQAIASAFPLDDLAPVGAIVADYAYGNSVADGIRQHLGDDVQIHTAPVGTSDFTSYLRQLPDDLGMLITNGHPPGALSMSNQAFEIGLSPERITGAHSEPRLAMDVLSDPARSAFAHIHTSDPYTDEFSQVGEQFVAERDLQWTTDTAYGYATMRMLAHAMDTAGAASPADINQSLKQISYDTIMAAPMEYTDNGELVDSVLIYSELLAESPSWDSDGNLSYEEITRSDPIPPRTF